MLNQLVSLGQGHQTDILDFLNQFTAMGYVCSSRQITSLWLL